MAIASISSLSETHIESRLSITNTIITSTMAVEAATFAILDHHINVNAGRKRVNNWYEKKGKTNKKLYNEMWAAKDHHSGASTNRRHFPANRLPPQRVASRPAYDVKLEEKLRMAKEEVRMLRDKIQLQHQESMEAMDFQEQFFKDQIKCILEGRVDDDGGKEEKKEDAADCNSGTSSVPVPESLPTKSIMQRIKGGIEKMRINKGEAAEKSFEEETFTLYP